MNGDVNSDLVEANHRRFMLDFGIAGGGRRLADPSLVGVVGAGPIDYHNCIVHAELDADQVAGRAEWWLRVLREAGVPGTWHAGPGSRPDDLVPRLLRAGFTSVASEPAMILAIDDLQPFRVPDDLQIERVTGLASLAEWEAVLSRSFGEGPPEAKWAASTFRSIGLSSRRWRVFLGRRAGTPVATAATFDDGKTIGMYFVAVDPTTRGLGIGTAITGLVARAQLNRGRRPVVLGASHMGYGVYRRLGFIDAGEIAIVS